MMIKKILIAIYEALEEYGERKAQAYLKMRYQRYI